jgi:two-component system nitrogen regulation sensor histidine kinase NtrY
MHMGAYMFFYLYPFEPKWISYAGQILVFVSFFLIVLAYNRFVRRMQPFQLGIGLLRNQDFSTKLVKTGNKHVDQAIELFNSMLEQLKKEKIERAEQEQFMNLLIEASPLGVIVLDFNKQIKSANPAAVDILQIDNNLVIGKELCELSSEVGEELAKLKMNEKKLVRLQMQQQYRLTKGSMIDRGHERYFFIIEELTDDIHDAEKNAWEKLIRVMAHEVNNTVGAVNSILSSIAESVDAEDEKEMMEVARKRNVSLTGFMNQYASIVKLEEPIKHSVSIKEVCDNVTKLFKPLFVENKIELAVNQDDFTVYGDMIQLEQAFQNVVQNAVESFRKEADRKFINVQINEKSREVIISNTGEPISDEIKANLFSPFFTTKSTGSGIGLMFVSEVLQKHSCNFSLATSNKLTSFKIIFPEN